MQSTLGGAEWVKKAGHDGLRFVLMEVQSRQNGEQTKVLVIGLGSIGRRHLDNLRRLGIRDISVHRTLQRLSPPRCDDAKMFEDVEEALSAGPDAAIICNPTALHVPVALAAARAGCHLFIEKPVSDSFEGIQDLQTLVREQGLRVLVGYQFRYNPGLRKIKQLLGEKAIGDIIHVRAHWGEYLPQWHPWEDYRNGYSSRKALGGGVILTLCHPFDYLRWLVGEIASVAAMAGHLSGLEIDVEDTSDILLEFESGGFGFVHLDYLQSPGAHSLEIIGEEGTIRWDNSDGAVRMQKRGQPEERYPAPAGYERNQMFLDELNHFLQCVTGVERPLVTLEDGIKALAVGLAAKRSARKRRTIEVKDVWNHRPL